MKPHFFFFILLSAGACAQNDNLDALLKRELQNQQRAKSGNKNPVVEIVDDPQKLQLIRSTVEKNLEQKQKAEAARAANLPPWDRYKHKDKSVVPELIGILNSRNRSKKRELFNGLSKEYDDPEDYAITDQDLIAQIFKAVGDPEYERSAVQLAGFNQLPGYEAVFEERLISGQSTDEGRIFFWLGKSGKSTRSLDYMEKRLKERPMISRQLDWVVTGLQYFGEKGDAALKSRVAELALHIYNNNISGQSVEELKQYSYSSNSAEITLSCLFDYGDKRVLPVAQDIFQRKIRFAGPVKAMIRLDGPQHLEKVNELLRQEKYFFDGIDIIKSTDKKYVSDQLLKDALIRFSKRSEIKAIHVERIVRAYIDLEADQLLVDMMQSLTDASLKERMEKTYALSRFRPELVAEDVYSIGIIDHKPGEAEIKELMQENRESAASFIHALLHKQKIMQSFDAETGMVPVDYDVLLMEFASKSQGVLKDLKVWMDAKEDKKAGNTKYTITTLAGNKAFIIKPEDIGDWYDVPLVSKLLDEILLHLGTPRRFVAVDTGDQTASFIFGEPAKVEALVKKYNL
jgi:hypothetical protein